ncbi:MAG: hypothetical protein V4805_06845 [Pseudomonadota bacterium]
MQAMMISARHKKSLGWLLGIAIVLWGGNFIYEIVDSWRFVATLCTQQALGQTEDALVTKAKRPGLRYTRLPQSDHAIIIADMTPDGPDCRITFDQGKVSAIAYDGNGYANGKD